MHTGDALNIGTKCHPYCSSKVRNGDLNIKLVLLYNSGNRTRMQTTANNFIIRVETLSGLQTSSSTITCFIFKVSKYILLITYRYILIFFCLLFLQLSFLQFGFVPFIHFLYFPISRDIFLNYIPIGIYTTRRMKMPKHG